MDLALAGGLVAVCLLAVIALGRERASVAHHRRIVDHLPQMAVLVFDHDLRIQFAGGPALARSGDGATEGIEGLTLLEVMPQVHEQAMTTHYRAALRGEQRSFEYQSMSNGRNFWVRVVPMEGSGGEIVGGLSVALDISDRGQIEREIGGRASDVDAVTEATRILARSVDATVARTAVCEAARQVADAPFAALFEPAYGLDGLAPRAEVGADLGDLRLGLAGESGAALAYSRAEEVFVGDNDFVHADDREFLRRAGAKAVLWHPVIRDRAAVGVLAIAWHDAVSGVSPRLSAMIDLLGAEAAVAIGRADLLGQLEHMARTDDLTGLPNRRYWEQQLPRELARSARDGQPICVAMLDLDHFKDYNDRRGHQAGDRLLGDAADAWRRLLRPYDMLARYGGEEFSVILPGCSLADAELLVERLRGVTPRGESCSAGIAEWDREERPDTLVGRADAALYRAKRAGRDSSIVARHGADGATKL